MRKLVAASVFVAVLVLPAAAMAQPRWYRGSKAEVTVYVERTRVGATNWRYVKLAGIEWARSSRIRMYGHPDGADYANLRRIYA